MLRGSRVAEGTWFVVPLERGYAIGLLARAQGSGGFGLFFRPRSDSPPVLGEVAAGASPSGAILACRFTLGKLRGSEWPIIGAHPDWRREEWPIPLLCRYDELANGYVVVQYAEDVFEPVAEFPLRSGDSPELYPSDDFFGEGLMPVTLERLLDSEADPDR